MRQETKESMIFIVASAVVELHRQGRRQVSTLCFVGVDDVQDGSADDVLFADALAPVEEESKGSKPMRFGSA